MDETTPKIIHTEKIEKSFGEQKVLKGVSLSVNKGEIFGLIGPSGAGKTTLIKILTGQLNIDAGTAFVCGESTGKLSDTFYLSVGTVFDSLGLFERLTCAQNLSIMAQITKTKPERIGEVLAAVGLSEYAKKKAYQLSKGMRQRLALARAFLHQPKLLFLDEPTSGLDPLNVEEIHQLILRQRENGTTVFLTTHKMEEAAKLCDRIAMLKDGVIIENDTPKRICQKYNVTNQICITKKDGQIITLPNDSSSADPIRMLFRENQIETIHSEEPSLSAIFLQIAKGGKAE